MPACEGAAELLAEPLTAAAFAAYGTVIEAPASGGAAINDGTALRHELVADLDLTREGGRAVLSLSRAQARSFPFAVREVERHALGSQGFIPLGTGRFFVVVAPPGPAPQPEELRAFVTDGHQGVVFAPGTWHHPLLAIDAGDFVVIERRAGDVDCDTHPLAQGRLLTLPV
jgi:ureidoglycolate lyase